MTGTELSKALDLERLAARLPGVRGAKVEAGPEGIRAVRLLVVPERDTESTVRQIRERASSELGIELDPATIHVLRTTRMGEMARPQRRKLTSLVTERADDVFRSRVTLELPGDVLVGESQMPPGDQFELRAVSKAVLESLSDLLDFRVELETVEIVPRGGHEIAMVSIQRANDRLYGTALVRTNRLDATARATLDALNRFLGSSLERQNEISIP